LGLTCLRDVNNRDIDALYDDCYPAIKQLREGKNEDHNKQMGMLEIVPSLYFLYKNKFSRILDGYYRIYFQLPWI
jgi:hypothetical protein